MKISYVTQYLHWALITAHQIENPDCSEVTIVLDLVNKQAWSSFKKRNEGHPDECECQACLPSPHSKERRSR